MTKQNSFGIKVKSAPLSIPRNLAFEHFLLKIPWLYLELKARQKEQLRKKKSFAFGVREGIWRIYSLT